MSEVIPFKRPISWKNMRSDEAQSLIHKRAKETDNILFGVHAFERVEERTILPRDVYRILQTGIVIDPPARNEKGDWEAVIRKRMPGTRDAAAVVIVFRNDETIFVKTVMWMDYLK